MSYQYRIPLALCTALAATAATAPMYAYAAVDTEVASLEEIVVTARKKSEDILQTPISVSAFTSEDIAARGIVSVTDIANATPGVNVNNNSAGRTDRSFQQVIIRGFTPAQTTISTVSMFVDGVPVSGATALSTITDPARVEILKGPQTAYFGRSTFAGAVNVVTKDPSDHFTGSGSVMVGSRSNNDIQGTLSGPIFGDLLSVRFSTRKFEKGGSYDNPSNPGETLGDQSTESQTLSLMSKPVDGLTIKLFGLNTVDHDGPSSQGIISAFSINGSNGSLMVPGQSNCTLNGYSNGNLSVTTGLPVGTPTARPFICGTAPNLVQGFSPAPNTINSAGIVNYLANPTNDKLIPASDGTHGYGLKNGYRHAHLNIDYDFGAGYTITSLSGINRNYTSELADLDNYNSRPLNNFDFPFLVERKQRDWSQELRLSYDNKGAFRGLFGASYLEAQTQSGLSTIFPPSARPIGGVTKNKTSGVFFGLSYDITEQWTVDVEGRYQKDTLEAYNPPRALSFIPGTVASGLIVKKTFNNFVPRVIVKFQITPDMMSYVSYSKGVNPGAFNTNALTQTANIQALAAAAGIGITVEPEKVTNYELGFKGKFFDNTLQLSSAIYYADWTNQINSVSANGIDSNGVAQIVSGFTNSGDVKLKGIEFDTTYLPIRGVKLNLAAAMNDTDIQKQVVPAVTQLTGVYDFTGKELPNTSKYSGNFGAEYDGTLSFAGDAAWFARGDVIYKSGVYDNQANTAKTPNSTTVNFRIGSSKGPMSIEAFMLNAFNNKDYTTIADNFIFTNTFAFTGANSALIVGLPDLRTWGVKLGYKF
jgi:iron complex outermembrane recepter protein